MFITKLILVFFSVTAIQACSETNDLPKQKEQLPCIKKLNLYKNMTALVKQRYDDFYKNLKALNLKADQLKQLEENHTVFEHKISEALAYYKEGSELVPLIKHGGQRLKLCRAYINESMKKLDDIEKLTLDMKTKLISVLNQSGLPPDTIKQIEKQFYHVINIIVIVDLSYLIGKGAYKFWKRSNAVEEGIPEDEIPLVEFEELMNEELGELEMGGEATQAARVGITKALQHLRTGNAAAAAEEAEAAALHAATAEANAAAASEAGAAAGHAATVEANAVAASEAGAAAAHAATAEASAATASETASSILGNTEVTGTIASTGAFSLGSLVQLALAVII